MIELLALFLVGLSLFFHGVGGIKSHLQGLSSRRLRRQLASWAGHPVLAGLWGFGFGAITQSSTAVAFILTGLVSSGLMTVARALPIVAWANLGTVLLVFFASFDLHLGFLYLLGTAGMALAFDLGGARLRPLLSTLFCVGLLFFGLQLMKDAFAPLSTFPWFRDFTGFIQGSAFAVFVAGALLRVLVQSSSGIAVIAIALAHGGLLTGGQAAMMMYGTGMGVGLSIYLLSANLRGVPRQIALYQTLINGFAGVTLAALYYVETMAGVPLLLALAEKLAADGGLRLAFVFLFLQATAVGTALIFSAPAARWLEKLAPATDEQDLARPRFLDETALADPESALDLVDKEQARLFGYLLAQLDTVRVETAGTVTLPAATVYRAGMAVGAEIQTFLRELIEQSSDRATSERLLGLEQRQSSLGALNETIFHFVETTGKLRAGTVLVEGDFLDRLAESLNTLLLTAADAIRGTDRADLDLLLGLTADRGEMMERLRRTTMTDFPGGDAPFKSHLFYLTSLFERTVWLLRQVAHAQQSLDRRPAADTQL